MHINEFGFHIDNMYNSATIIGSSADGALDEVFSIFSICFVLSSWLVAAALCLCCLISS